MYILKLVKFEDFYQADYSSYWLAKDGGNEK